MHTPFNTVGDEEVSRKNNYVEFDEFDEVEEWADVVRARNRWHEHETSRRHTGNPKEELRKEKSQHQRRHINPRGLREVE